MNKLKTNKFLKELNACPEAIKWAQNKTMIKVWKDCDRGDWMLWLMKKANLCDLRKLTLAKVRCASLVRHLMKDERSIKAMEVAERFANNEASQSELAAYAAYAAAAAAAAAERSKILAQCAEICREVLPYNELKTVIEEKP